MPYTGGSRDNISSYQCDACGNPATNFARDLLRTTGPLDAVDTFAILGLKCGCAQHPVRSICYDEHGKEV